MIAVQECLNRGLAYARNKVLRVAHGVPSPVLHRWAGHIPQALTLREISPLPFVRRNVVETSLRILGFLPGGEKLSDRYYVLILETAKELGRTLHKPADLAAVAVHIEAQRRRVNDAAFEQIKQLSSATAAKIEGLSPVERAWLKRAAQRLAPLADEIYSRQSSSDVSYQHCLELLQKAGHAPSLEHFKRIRTPEVPLLRPSFIPQSVGDAAKVASSLPWFPDGPAFNAMLPADLTKEELSYFERNYPASHPVRRPYTVVERLDLKTVQRMATRGFLRNGRGERVEWVVRGKDGIRYRVTNICFHENFKPLFNEFAGELRASAAIEAEGEKLPEPFKRYLLEVAEAIVEGDFSAWLKADIAQEGRIFFTFFPHEGYWPDNLKFPFLFEIGIVDQHLNTVDETDQWVVAKLRERAAAVAQKLGMTLSAEGERREITRFIWTYKEVGYLGAFPHGSAAGHDYPKVSYPGVDAHCTVIIVDAAAAVWEAKKNFMAHFFGPVLAAGQTVGRMLQFAKWHEVQHGIEGNKPDTVRSDGRTMGEVFGEDWALVAEPGGDMGSLVAAKLRRDAGYISQEEMEGIYLQALFRAIGTLRPKTMALSEAFIKKGIHAVGQVLFISYLFKDGRQVIRFNDDGILTVDFNGLLAAVGELDEKLLSFGLSGSVEDFIAFYRETVQCVPDDFIVRIREMVSKLERMYLVSRPA